MSKTLVQQFLTSWGNLTYACNKNLSAELVMEMLGHYFMPNGFFAKFLPGKGKTDIVFPELPNIPIEQDAKTKERNTLSLYYDNNYGIIEAERRIREEDEMDCWRFSIPKSTNCIFTSVMKLFITEQKTFWELDLVYNKMIIGSITFSLLPDEDIITLRNSSKVMLQIEKDSLGSTPELQILRHFMLEWQDCIKGILSITPQEEEKTIQSLIISRYVQCPECTARRRVEVNCHKTCCDCCKKEFDC